MAKVFLMKTKEAVGVLPAMGLKVVIEEIEKGETGENAATPGALMYSAILRVTEPERFKGATLRDWFPIGTKDDKKAKREETWKRSEGGPGRLVRMLRRAGVAITDDDDEWMEASEGAEVCITVTKRRDENGELRNRVGMYFREEDPDFVGIGEETEAEEDAAGRGGRGRGGRAARGGNAKAGPVAVRTRNKPPAEDEEEDEAAASKTARKTKKPEDEDEAEEDENGEEEETPPSPRRATKAKRAAAAKDDDADEDED
jgi:hypothetical protein